MVKLAKRVVDATAPDPARRFLVWDEQIKGFGLVVYPSGVKSYAFRYRTPEGRERHVHIGPNGAGTAEQARRRDVRL